MHCHIFMSRSGNGGKRQKIFDILFPGKGWKYFMACDSIITSVK